MTAKLRTVFLPPANDRQYGLGGNESRRGSVVMMLKIGQSAFRHWRKLNARFPDCVPPRRESLDCWSPETQLRCLIEFPWTTTLDTLLGALEDPNSLS